MKIRVNCSLGFVRLENLQRRKKGAGPGTSACSRTVSSRPTTRKGLRSTRFSNIPRSPKRWIPVMAADGKLPWSQEWWNIQGVASNSSVGNKELFLLLRILDWEGKWSVEALSEWYSSDKCNQQPRPMLTAAVIVKDVNHLISEIVTRTTTPDTARVAGGDH